MNVVEHFETGSRYCKNERQGHSFRFPKTEGLFFVLFLGLLLILVSSSHALTERIGVGEGTERFPEERVTCEQAEHALGTLIREEEYFEEVLLPRIVNESQRLISDEEGLLRRLERCPDSPMEYTFKVEAYNELMDRWNTLNQQLESVFRGMRDHYTAMDRMIESVTDADCRDRLRNAVRDLVSRSWDAYVSSGLQIPDGELYRRALRLLGAIHARLTECRMAVFSQWAEE